jgi:DHA2 family multidrug resistance protein
MPVKHPLFKSDRRLLPRANHDHISHRWLVLFTVMLGTFLAGVNSSIVNVGITSIMNTFGSSVDKIEWVITAYMLAMAVMLPASGWIADHFGYKRSYFSALGLFTFGSLVCGLAWNETSLIVFRVIQGIGGGLIMPVGMAIITMTFPPGKRGMALGFWGIASAASVSFGPVIGGYIIDNFSWHMMFFINIPIGLIGLAASVIILKEYRSGDASRFDFGGAVSITVCLTSLLLALACGNSSWNTDGWHSNLMITCYTLAAISFVIFLYIDLRIEFPIINLRLLKNLNLSMASLVFFIYGIAMFGSTFLLPLYLQNSMGYTAFQAGLVFIPYGIMMAVMSPVSGALSDRYNPKISVSLGIALLVISFYMQKFLSLDSSRFQIMFPLIPRGIGLGMIIAPLTKLAMADMESRNYAQASGLFNVIRQIGGSFGIAILGTILTGQTIIHSTNYIQSINRNSPAFQQSVFTGKTVIEQFSGRKEQESIEISRLSIFRSAENQALVSAISDDFMIAGIATLLCFIPLFMLKNRKNESGINDFWIIEEAYLAEAIAKTGYQNE